MNKGKIDKYIRDEVFFLKRSSLILSYRRINWRVVAQYKIYRTFEYFINKADKNDYPFKLYLNYEEMGNEAVIRIDSQRCPLETFDKKIKSDEEKVLKRFIFEEGGSLVAKFDIAGYVNFFVYPRNSDRMKSKKQEIFISERLDPKDVTDIVLEKVLCRYMLWMRSTSIFGAHHSLSIFDRMSLIFMKIRDSRYKYNLYRDLISMKNEWFKLIVTGLISFLVGYILGSDAKCLIL